MIMRTWRGAVRREDADRYLDHQAKTGIREYRETPGILGAMVLSPERRARRGHHGLVLGLDGRDQGLRRR